MAFWNRRKSLASVSARAAHSALRPTLSWPHLIGLGVGAIVGTGIYTLTGVGAGLAGPAVILSFAIAGLVCACAALAYAEMATMMPMAGSAYTFPDWLLAGPHAGRIVSMPAIVISIAVAGLLTLGSRESATVNLILVVVKLAALGAFIVLALPAFDARHFEPFMPYGFAATEIDGVKHGVIGAAAIIFFAFYGFDAVSTAAVLMTLLTGLIVSAIAGVMPLREIAELANAGTLVAFIAVATCMLVLPARAPDHPRTFRAPAPRVLGVLAIAGCAYLFWSLPGITLQRFLLCNGVGLLVYLLYARRRSALAHAASQSSRRQSSRA